MSLSLNIINYIKLERFIFIIILAIISIMAIKISSYLIQKLTKKFDIELTLSYLLRDIIRYLIVIIAVIIALNAYGVNVSGVLLSVGILSIVVGFAAKDIISNFISGISLLLDKTIKVGETIEVDEVSGTVKKVGFRTMTLITSDELIVTVPNSFLSTNPYINHTYLDEYRIDLNIVLPCEKDLLVLKNELLSSCSKLEWVLKKSQPILDVQELGSERTKIKLSVWAKDYSKRWEYKLILANQIREIISNC